MELWYCLTIAFIIFIIIELIFRSIIVSVNKKFQWMIIDKDEVIEFSNVKEIFIASVDKN